MPFRWVYNTREEFTALYGTGPIWSKTQSYHMFIHDGNPLFRIWTNTKAEFAWVDIDTTKLAPMLVPVEVIPSGNIKKCKPFTQRIKITTQEQLLTLIILMRHKYGLDK